MDTSSKKLADELLLVDNLDFNTRMKRSILQAWLLIATNLKALKEDGIINESMNLEEIIKVLEQGPKD